jgi:hypothetical protein
MVVTSTLAEEDLLTLADGRITDWNRSSRFWYVLYYSLGSIAVLLTITVASKPQFLSDTLSTLAWLAAIFQGLSTFLAALSKATAYRAAWRTLWLTRLEYLESGKSAEAGKLLRQAIARGWSIIDGGYSGAFQPQPHTRHIDDP